MSMVRMGVVLSLGLNMIHHPGLNVSDIGSDPFCIQRGMATMLPIR